MHTVHCAQPHWRDHSMWKQSYTTQVHALSFTPPSGVSGSIVLPPICACTLWFRRVRRPPTHLMVCWKPMFAKGVQLTPRNHRVRCMGVQSKRWHRQREKTARGSFKALYENVTKREWTHNLILHTYPLSNRKEQKLNRLFCVCFPVMTKNGSEKVKHPIQNRVADIYLNRWLRQRYLKAK